MTLADLNCMNKFVQSGMKILKRDWSQVQKDLYAWNT